MTTREERARERALKRKKQKLVTFFTIFVAVIIAVLIAIGIILNKVTPNEIDASAGTTETPTSGAQECYDSFMASSAVLRDYVFENDNIEQTVKTELGNAFNANITVFLSVSDGTKAAHVVSGTAQSLDGAWTAAENKMGEYVKDKLCKAVYVKADIVNKEEIINSSELNSRISSEAGLYGEYFRKGISFDSTFSSALLEAEINSNELIDYDIAKNIVLDKVNLYLASKGCPEVSSVPDKLYLFSCRGYIKDIDGCYSLGSQVNSSYGRREIKSVDLNCVNDTLSLVGKYLSSNMSADGKFTYGIYPVIGLPIEQYDIGYHAMALDSLIRFAEKYDPAGLYKADIEAAVGYLKGQIVTSDENNAWAANISSGEITAGGNIQAIIALCDYLEYADDSSAADTAKKLGNALVSMIDKSTGKPNHVLYYKSTSGADFAVKTAQSDRAYDSSAVYALCRLYGATEDEKYLTAASSVADALIKDNYAQYADAWVTVAMEELTKYNKKPEYYNLALKNCADNISALETRIISMPQYLRLLVGTYNIYETMKAEKITTDLYTSFDFDKLVTVAAARAEDLLNTVAYPEFAMYFQNPEDCMYASFVRQDGFRIRIDDMAAFINAYLSYAEKYTQISADAFNIASKQAAKQTTAAQ